MIDNMLENKERGNNQRGNSHKKDGSSRQPRFLAVLESIFLGFYNL